MDRHLIGGGTRFGESLQCAIRMLLVEEGRYLSEDDLAHALKTRLNGMDEVIARDAASIAWAITWLHPLALGFFVFGLCAKAEWFEDESSDGYIARLLHITPSHQAREALALYNRYQAAEPDGGDAVIRGFGIECLDDLDERVFGAH